MDSPTTGDIYQQGKNSRRHPQRLGIMMGTIHTQWAPCTPKGHFAHPMDDVDVVRENVIEEGRWNMT